MQLDGRDVGALLRLVGECHELLAVGQSPWAHALTEIARVTAAQVAIWCEGQARVGSALAPTLIAETGWSCESDRSKVWSYWASATTNPILARVAMQGAQTFTRRDVIPDELWDKSTLENEVYRSVGIGDMLVSTRTDARGDIGAFVLKRTRRDRGFGDRECDLLSMLQSSCVWMSSRITDSVKLSPRERDTLEHLLTGAREKQIADSLEVSKHTVHQYVKSIYRKLGVTSRAELLALRRSPI
jgi:DNA-binding CsgD family transcriptional regulator